VHLRPTFLCFSLLLAATMASAAADAPTAESLLKRYDEVMGPPSFECESSMSSTREDGSTRTYKMKMLRSDDKFRIWFKEPASVKGQEILRQGDSLWVYLPNLKRATRMANRESFQGGDFNNADVLRVNYVTDYSGTLGDSGSPESLMVNLKARHGNTAYDTIKLWFRKSDRMPLKAEYFGSSGQILRSAEFSEIKQMDKGYSRPTKITMRNELVKSRSSQIVFHTLKLNADAPAQRFTLTDLGR
jgi:outer membrane lipoprotein-sorting protein